MVVYLDQYNPPKSFWKMSISELVKYNNKCIKLDKKSNFKYKIRKRRRKTRNRRNRKTKKKRNKFTRRIQ